MQAHYDIYFLALRIKPLLNLVFWSIELVQKVTRQR
jgi:hypothetical protein